jgi:Ca2+-binding EF-hand superfamily protein
MLWWALAESCWREKEEAGMVKPVRFQAGGPGDGDLGAQFAGAILAELAKKIPEADRAKSLDAQATGLIGAIEKGHESQDDNKINADELAKFLNITKEEAQRFITAYNTKDDPDNALDQTELAKALQTVQEPPQGGDPKGGQQAGGSGGGGSGGGGAGGSEGAGSGGGGIAALLRLLTGLIDEDGDGKIDKEELEKFLKKYDKNGNGQLEKGELAEGLKAEAKAKGGQISDEEIDTLLSKIDSQLIEAGEADKKEGLSLDEFTKVLGTSTEAEA